MLSSVIVYIFTTALNTVFVYKVLDRYEASKLGEILESLLGGFLVALFGAVAASFVVVSAYGISEWYNSPAPTFLGIGIVLGVPILVKNCSWD